MLLLKKMAILENPKISFRENRKLVFLIILAVLIVLAVIYFSLTFFFKPKEKPLPGREIAALSGKVVKIGQDWLDISLPSQKQGYVFQSEVKKIIINKNTKFEGFGALAALKPEQNLTVYYINEPVQVFPNELSAVRIVVK